MHRFLLTGCWLLFTPLMAQSPAREVVPAAVTLAAQPDEKGRSVWHTANFRIDLDVVLSAEELKRIAQVVEGTAAVVRRHSLPLFSPPEGRARVAIFAEDDDYAAAGGVTGTAGYYDGRSGLVLIRGKSLVRGAAGGVRLPPLNDEDLVVHELVHLCMHGVNRRMPQWFVEGIAEYFASAHSGAGRFSFSNPDVAVRDHLRVRLSPEDPRIALVPLGDIVELDDRGWLRVMIGLRPEERYRSYASALLLTHYHLHGGRERYEWLVAALATPARRGGAMPKADLTGVEDAIARYWRPRGLTAEFRLPPPGEGPFGR